MAVFEETEPICLLSVAQCAMPMDSTTLRTLGASLGPGSHQPPFKDWRMWGGVGGWEGCSHGAMHCDLLLFELYVHCSIYHVLYLSTFQCPCPPSMVFLCVCVASVGQLEHAGTGLPENVLVAGGRSPI